MTAVGVLRAIAEDWPAPFVLRTVPVTAPAAGADWTLTAPGEGAWSLVSLSAKLVTSAIVANRAPVLALTDGTTTLWKMTTGAAITASLTTQVSWFPDAGHSNTSIIGGALQVGLPPVLLQPGWTLGPTTAAIDATDQWSGIVAQVVEVFTGEREHERAIAQGIIDRIVARLDVWEGLV